MTETILEFLKWALMMLPFVLLAFLNYKANLKRDIRYKQFLMPIIAVLLVILVVALLSDIYDFCIDFVQKIPGWIEDLADNLYDALGSDAESIVEMLEELAENAEKAIEDMNLNFWAFYIANALVLLAYVIVKKIILLLLKALFKDGGLFQTLAGAFYEYDEDHGYWALKPMFGQARTFLKSLYVFAVVLGVAGVLVSSWLYEQELLTALYYPVFSVIILGELYFALDGLTKKELQHSLTGEAEEADHFSDYSLMRGVLKRLFPDKLNAQNTAVSDVTIDATTNEELLTALEDSDNVAEEAYGRFMRQKTLDGMELDFNYLKSGRQLLNGQSVLFNNPFYYDLIPYMFFPMNRALLRHRKVLIILGRHGAQEDVQKWCVDGLTAITNIPTMWNVGVLTEDKQELDVGIITRSDVHNLQMHEANRDFFDEVEFVVLIEPSRLVTTAQIGLNSIIRHCRRKKKPLVFCSTDKNCDGLVDSLSHILMSSLEEVSATKHYQGASSYMIWEADGDHLQHRMLPNLSRYLGMGTELSFAALKNQVPATHWYGGDAFPVKDMHWITKQYYYDLMRYANLPPNQEYLDQVFRVSSDMWSLPAAPNQYITVEDESFNMFEVKRDFASRATDQGFVNVICSDYLLKDYMADNDTIFDADPKAIPYICADYARTVRNVVLRLCLRMSTRPVPADEIRRELVMIDRDTRDPAAVLWQEICAVCGHAGSSGLDQDGRLVLTSQHKGEEHVFTAEVLELKRRFNMDTGRMEDMYAITNRRFIQTILGDLRLAEYVAEDENGKRQYLGTELCGQIFQKYLPGQFFTFDGKYYEMLRVTSEGQVLVRRASDHINGRPFYRQERKYFIDTAVDSTVMGECRDMGAFRVTRQFADIRVETPAYWHMNRYNDFGTARRVGINGIPQRVYRNKSIIRIDLNIASQMPEGTVSTLTVLINEVLRTLLAENQDYLVAVMPGEAKAPTTYSLQVAEGQGASENSIYLLEDSQMDIGLLDIVERNLNRIFEIICDYLQWHEETLEKERRAGDAPVAAPAPEEEAEPAPEPPKKRGFFGRIFDAIARFFGAIGAFFKKIFTAIGDFFKKLFGIKPKSGEPASEPQTPVSVPEPPVSSEPAAEPELPVEEPAAEEAPVEETTEEETSVEETPVEETPVEEAPVEEAPVEETPVEPAAETPVEFEIPPFEEDETTGEDETTADDGFMALCNGGEFVSADVQDTPDDSDVDLAPVDSAAGADNDTVDFEPEQVIPAGAVDFSRAAYKDRYYLRYGSDEIAAALQLAGVKELLLRLGYGNNALTQARKGKDIAELVERTFVPDRQGSHYCDFCGNEITGLEYDVLADGRERCSVCSRTAVRDLKEFVALHDTVLRNMKLFFGVKINVPVHVQMVNSKKLHKKLGKTFIPTGDTDGRVLGVAIKERNSYSILVENGAPKLESIKTMVHEMTHIWQYTNWDTKAITQTYGDKELEVYEGMAKWVEIQYTYMLSEIAAAKREELITRHRDDPYGRGFIKYAEKYPLSIGSHEGGVTPFNNPKKPL